jgi:Tol biopolymer transport system component
MNRKLASLILELIVVGLWLAGCGQAATLAPTATPTRTPLPTRTATAIPPTPRPTPSPTLLGESAGKLAYVSCSSSEDTSCEIYVINADGSHPIRLTNDNAWNCCPAWSPDGAKLAFVANEDGPVQGPHGAIYVINADGSHLTQLTSSANIAAENPTWSPDGTKIAFANWAFPGAGIIHVMNADGSHMTRPTGGVPAYANSPLNWSPDGARIAFESHNYVPDASNHDIHVLNTDGSGDTNLTDNSFYDGMPTWSPDGTKIAFVSDRDGNLEIYVINADGSKPT